MPGTHPKTMTWLPEYSVGSAAMDTQHRQLLDICGRIEEIASAHPADYAECFHIILNELAAYASNHFSDEEALLAEIKFSSLDDHKLEHEHYFDYLSELLYDATHGKLDLDRLRYLTTDWWIKHILESDMQYKAQLCGLNNHPSGTREEA